MRILLDGIAVVLPWSILFAPVGLVDCLHASWRLPSVCTKPASAFLMEF